MACSSPWTIESLGPNIFSATSRAVSGRMGGGADAKGSRSGPRPSMYRTLERHIAIDCSLFSRTAIASISASPSPNGGGFHPPLLFASSFSTVFLWSSRMWRGSLATSRFMYSAQCAT